MSQNTSHGCCGSHEAVATADPEVVEILKRGVLDVRPVPPARKHALIFAAFEALTNGQSFLLVNDHDPKPLYYQFAYEKPGAFTWAYEEQGPQVWRVRIGKGPTLSPI